MDNNIERKGFWRKTAEFFTGAPEVRSTGSVGSYGGDSLLSGAQPPAPSSTSDEVTVINALGMSAVYRAVSILSTSVSQLELGVWRSTQELKTVPGLVGKPDVNTSLSTFLKRTTISMAATGNCYWRVYRADAGSTVQNLEVLNPQAMFIRYDDSGNMYYDYEGYGKTVSFKAWQIQHLKLLEVPGSAYGLGPIQAAKNELRSALDLRLYADNWFTKGAIPTGVLSTKDYMDAATAAEYRTRWETYQANRGVAVLGNGMEYQPILLNPADAQFLENQAFSITQVARLFGIPSNYLLAEVNGNVMTYQNMEQVDTAFVKYTLTQYLREIEEAFSNLLPRGQRARFKLEGFLRADDKTRAEVAQIYKNMGVLSAEEIRLSEGWGDMPAHLKAANAVPAPAPGIAGNNPQGGNTNGN